MNSLQQLSLIFICLTVISLSEAFRKPNLSSTKNYQSIDEELNADEFDLEDPDLFNERNENTILTDLEGSEKHRLVRKHPLLLDWTSSCGECDPELCEPTPADCPSGLIRDACDCCYVCGNLEETPCDLPGFQFRYGQCSDGLICIQTTTQETRAISGFCACAMSTVLCGNDNRTYLNPCQFKRASGRKKNLRKVHEGPCVTAPTVDIPPMNESAEIGSSAVFSCTAAGFPFPWFEWYKDGENVFQPGLSDEVTVQIRSGPLKYQITTWLEIKKTKQIHEGLYTCIAKNSLGAANATALLEVIEDDYDVSNHYVFRGKHYHFSNDEVAIESSLRNSTTENSTFLSDTETISASNTTRPIGNNVVDSGDSLNERNSSEEYLVDEKLVKTLKELVKPKEFKDIFFDDDDLSEGGSGIS